MKFINRNTSGQPSPKKGCVDGPRVYKESSFGRSYRAPTDILRLCWKEELVPVTTLEPGSSPQTAMPQCAVASTPSLHSPHQVHTYESWLQKAQLQGLVIYRVTALAACCNHLGAFQNTEPKDSLQKSWSHGQGCGVRIRDFRIRWLIVSKEADLRMLTHPSTTQLVLKQSTGCLFQHGDPLLCSLEMLATNIHLHTNGNKWLF